MPDWVPCPRQHQLVPWPGGLCCLEFFRTLLRFSVLTSLVYRQTLWAVEKWIANVLYGQTVIY